MCSMWCGGPVFSCWNHCGPIKATSRRALTQVSQVQFRSAMMAPDRKRPCVCLLDPVLSANDKLDNVWALQGLGGRPHITVFQFPWPMLGALWTFLGLSWGYLGLSWAHVEVSCDFTRLQVKSSQTLIYITSTTSYRATVSLPLSSPRVRSVSQTL